MQPVDAPHPDLLPVLQTSLLPVDSAVLHALRDPEAFSKLCWGMAENSFMVEEHCDELDVPCDVKPDGTDYTRDEMKLPLGNKRHVLLTNGVLADGRRAATAAATTAAETVTATDTTLVERKPRENQKCEEQVLALSGASFASSELAHFGTKGNATLLKSFLHVRRRSTSATKGLGFPNRGKVPVDVQAETAAVNTILRDSNDCVAKVREKSGKALASSGVEAFATPGNTEKLRACHCARKRTGVANAGVTVPNRGKLVEAQKSPPVRNLFFLCWEARNDKVDAGVPTASCPPAAARHPAGEHPP